MTTVAAFVLTGGKSSRMGQEKSALLLNGNTLLERAIEIAHAASDDVQLLGAPYLPAVGSVDYRHPGSLSRLRTTRRNRCRTRRH